MTYSFEEHEEDHQVAGPPVPTDRFRGALKTVQVLGTQLLSWAKGQDLQENDGDKIRLLTPYTPPTLVGGVCTLTADDDADKLVEQAAMQACSAERVHTVSRVMGDRVFYLAVPSHDLASQPSGWCPFAALLPGMPSARQLPVCYTHYADSTGILMMLAADTLQIYYGNSLIARAKAERWVREHQKAELVPVTVDFIAQLKPEAWHSRILQTEHFSRVMAAGLIRLAMIVAGLAFLVWIYAAWLWASSLHAAMPSNAGVDRHRTPIEGQEWSDIAANPLHRQLADFVALNDSLLALDGFMQTYRYKNDQAYWRAVVAATTPPDAVKNMGGVILRADGDGKLLIGYGVDDPATPTPTLSTQGSKP